MIICDNYIYELIITWLYDNYMNMKIIWINNYIYDYISYMIIIMPIKQICDNKMN